MYSFFVIMAGFIIALFLAILQIPLKTPLLIFAIIVIITSLIQLILVVKNEDGEKRMSVVAFAAIFSAFGIILGIVILNVALNLSEKTSAITILGSSLF